MILQTLTKRQIPQARAWLARIRGEDVFSFVACALLARAVLLESATPMVSAFFVAGLLGGLSPTGMMLGAIAGTATLLPNVPLGTLWQPFIMSLMWVLQPVWKDKRGIAAVILALVSMIPVAFYASGIPYQWLVGCVSALLSSILMVLYHQSLSLKARRRVLSVEEIASVAIFVSSLGLGLYGVSVYGASIGRIIALLTIMTMGYSGGAGLGAATGAIWGIVFAIGGGDPFLMANLSVCGLVAGVFRKQPRFVLAVACVLSSALVTLAINASTRIILPFVEIMVAGTALVVAPKSMLRLLRRYMDPITFSGQAAEDMGRFRVRAAGDLTSYAVLYENMATLMRVGRRENKRTLEAALMEDAELALCTGCAHRVSCWQSQDGRMQRDVLRMAAMVEHQGWISDAQLPAHLRRTCCRTDMAVPRLVPVMIKHITLNLQQEQLEKHRLMMATQLTGMGESVRMLAEQYRQGCKVDEELTRQALEALDKANYNVSSLWVEKNSDGRLRVEACVEGLTARSADELTQKLSEALDVRMALCTELSQEEPKGRRAHAVDGTAALAPVVEQLLFEQEAAYGILTGVAQHAADKAVCGDSFTSSILPSSRALLLISDGMGTGEAAGQESSAAVELLEQQLKVGVRESSAVELVNQLLMLLSTNDMFATLDLCVIDLVSGYAKMVKVGAAPALLVRSQGVTRLADAALPLGVVQDVHPVRKDFRLSDGDLLVMLSDGVWDAQPDASWLETLVLEDLGHNPQALADHILDEALARAQGTADDMTVIAARIFKR